MHKANFRFHHSLEKGEAMEALGLRTHYKDFYEDSCQDSYFYRTTRNRGIRNSISLILAWIDPTLPLQ
jgi:hypothetical protein